MNSELQKELLDAMDWIVANPEEALKCSQAHWEDKRMVLPEAEALRADKWIEILDLLEKAKGVQA